MTLREAIGYLVLIALVSAIGYAVWRWRRQAMADRLKRWGNLRSPYDPRHKSRRGR